MFQAEFSEKLHESNFEPSQDHMHVLTSDISSFDGFLSHLRVPPVCFERLDGSSLAGAPFEKGGTVEDNI